MRSFKGDNDKQHVIDALTTIIVKCLQKSTKYRIFGETINQTQTDKLCEGNKARPISG